MYIKYKIGIQNTFLQTNNIQLKLLYYNSYNTYGTYVNLKKYYWNGLLILFNIFLFCNTFMSVVCTLFY